MKICDTYTNTLYEDEHTVLARTINDAVAGDVSLAGADLAGATLAWNSPDLIAELLRRDAANNREGRMLAEMVQLNRNSSLNDSPTKARKLSEETRGRQGVGR